MRRRHLTPEQTERLNSTLRHLADDLERKKALRESIEHAEKLAREVSDLAFELRAG